MEQLKQEVGGANNAHVLSMVFFSGVGLYSGGGGGGEIVLRVGLLYTGPTIAVLCIIFSY